jgi:hypothetical protein
MSCTSFDRDEHWPNNVDNHSVQFMRCRRDEQAHSMNHMQALVHCIDIPTVVAAPATVYASCVEKGRLQLCCIIPRAHV